MFQNTKPSRNLAKMLLVAVLYFSVTSCKKEEIKYPIYTLTTIKYIPDSLKVKHREWIKETIRASNQHLSAGDYEDIDQTIIQAKWTADKLFEKTIIGLRKEIDDNYYNSIKLKPSELNKYEKSILDSLVNSH